MKNVFQNLIAGVVGVFLLNACASIDATSSKQGSKSKVKRDLSFELGVGASYNSNVSVSALDNNTGANDTRANIYGQVRYEKDLSANTEFNARYRYSQTNHSKLSRFDRQTHFLSTGLEHDFGDIEAGVNYRYYDGALDNDGFISSHRISPFIKKRINKKILARAFYAYSDKSFDTSISRDAKENEGGVSFYYFINGSRQYIQTQYSYKDVNSFGPEFDYGAHKARVRYTKRVPFYGRRVRLRGAYRFEQRNYDNVTPSIAALRDDTRHRLIGDVYVPITDNVFGKLEYQHAINKSNLPSADYNRDLLTVTLAVKY